MSGIPAGAGSLLGKRLGNYEILALLALGGTAEIYLARIGGAAGFEKYVVVKSIHDHLADDQEFVKMFLDEARLAAHLDHSNIVQTMELGEHEDRYFMVMEFLAGLSLAMVVRRAGERLPGGRMPAPLVLNMMAQSCAGLHYAHERAINGKALNIVHRDISPQNLVVSFEGVCKVVDFGIAKAEQRQTATRAGTIKGKFAYMSPEQCVAANVDRRTDVFALGVIAHEMLTGQRLFKRTSPYETYQAVIDCVVEKPSKVNSELDPALDDVIMRSLAKDKEHRYPTAEAFGDALLGYLHHRGKGSGPGDLARFFDEAFAQEIEEHGARMRELIEGRDHTVDTGGQWGADEEAAAEAKRAETRDLSSRRGSAEQDELSSMSLSTSDMMPDRAGQDPVADPDGDDSDMPADRTRIESNPLEKLKSMEQQPKAIPSVAKARQQPNTQRGSQPGLPRVPSATSTPAGGRAAVPPKVAPSGPGQGPASSNARFPNYSNLATQAIDELVDAPEFAETAMASELPEGRGAPVQQQPATGGQRSNLPMTYPVMNPEFNQQMASGAVFPSAPAAASCASAESLLRGSVTDSGGRPQPGYAPESGPQPAQQAANMMSPVGQQYPQQVNWAEAAAAPARALPPWMMIALFVAAIVVALVLTIVVAKIIR